MGLPVPVLDERSYNELRDELVRRIPVRSSEWTDFNESDPGVTLVQLFTFLADSLLWQVDKRQRQRQRRRRRLAILVVGTAGIGLILWTWSRLRPESEDCDHPGGAWSPEIAVDLTCAECGRSPRAGETWRILFADKVAREAVTTARSAPSGSSNRRQLANSRGGDPAR